jgi:hypothetical protein
VISAEPLPGSPELARLGRGEVGTLRINLAWGSVQSSPGAPFDWSHYDPVIAGAARNGIRVLATVYSSPEWAEPTPEYPPLGSRLSQFEDFVRAAAGRYGANGSFWREHPDMPKLPVTDWQVWNEPNSPLFWKPKPDPAGYLALLRGFDAAAHDADPAARIVLGGLFPTPRGGIEMGDFMRALYRGGAQDLFDAAAIHPYAANPQDALGRTGDLRDVMDHEGDQDGGIWISEVGWASAGQPSGLTVGPARQAAYLTQTYRLAAEARDRLELEGVIWFSLNDTPGPLWPGHCGLFELDGSAKPSWEAFVELTRDRPVHVRFIEFMPLDRRVAGDDGLGGDRLLPAPAVLERLKASFALEPHDGPYGHGPARYWQVPGYAGTVGFIAGVSEHFCETCNRLRLTADGRLRTCLFSGDEIEVRPLISRPAELRAAIRAAVSGKSYDRCRELRANQRAMSQIGG